MDHMSSCERGRRRHQFVPHAFPQLPALFGDAAKLAGGAAREVVRGCAEQVPPRDIFVSGFVCKNASLENPAGKTLPNVSAPRGNPDCVWDSDSWVKRNTVAVCVGSWQAHVPKSLGCIGVLLAVAKAARRLLRS